MENKKRQYRAYSDQDVIDIAVKVNSMSKLLTELNLVCAGGNYAHMKKTIQRLDIDCSHWEGQGWSKAKRLKDWKDYSKIKNLKPHLIKKRGHICENCSNKEWMNEMIPLEVDHIDGDRTNNSEDNLKLLCCNCHALTPTWRGRSNKK